MILDNGYSAENFEIPSEYTYRGEGNCNVVLSLPKSRKILRVKKSDKPKSIIGWILVLISDFLFWYCGRGFKDELRDVAFYSNVMRPLIGNNYTSEASQVVLSRKQIKILNDQLDKIRPDSRRHKTLQYGRAAIFDDFAFLPIDSYNFQLSADTFAVEIKPKQGWRTPQDKRFTKCSFCMHQYLKFEKKQIDQITEYCPEDLFSGDKNQMTTALKRLYEVPQNNFRIFKNGVLHYGEKQKGPMILHEIFENHDDSHEVILEEFCHFLHKCLMTDLRVDCDNNFLKTSCNCNLDSKSCDNGTSLPTGCVLEKILTVQKLDTEGTQVVYKKLTKEHVDDWKYVRKLIDKIKQAGNRCVKCILREMENTSEDELAFAPYLISAIAKDCSLMVTFRKVKEHVSENLNIRNLFQTKYGYYLVNIGVFDLYPKPLSTIQKHYKRDKEIIKAYRKAIQDIK